ncbi:MAG: hypothetical protein ACXW1M_05100 [Acidimicrobiia bacterium]
MRPSVCARVLIVVALALAVAACGGDDDTTASSPPPATDVETASQAACTLLTPADATTLFGVPAQPKADDQPKSVASQCIYESAGLDGQLVQFRIFDNERYYSKNLVEDGKAITGLGTKAYIDTQGPDGIVDLQFVHDGKVYALAYSNTTGDAATRASNLELLARAIDDRL